MTNTKANEQPEETIEQYIARMQAVAKEDRAIIDRYKAEFAKRQEVATKQKHNPPTFPDFEAFAHLAGITPKQVRMIRLKMRLRDIVNSR